MPRKDKRLSRASSRSRGAETDDEMQSEHLAEIEVENKTIMSNKSAEKERNHFSNVCSENVTPSSFGQQPCGSENETSSKARKNKVNNSRKKRPSSNDDEERENINCSKPKIASVSPASRRKQERFSNRDKHNKLNQLRNINLIPRRVTLKCTKPIFTPTELPPPNISNLSIATALNTPPQDPTIPGQNIYCNYFNSTIGHFPRNSKSFIHKVATHLSNFEVVDSDHPFRCRITAVEWHPRKPSFLAVGSKHGDMVFYKVRGADYSKLELLQRLEGTGPGGYISGMKFHPIQDNVVFTSSLCGKVVLNDIERCKKQVLLDTLSWEHWFSSLDVHKTDSLVCAGRNRGVASLLDRDGNSVWDIRLHSQKISHVEFSSQNPRMFVTASLDHNVKVWDLRKVEAHNPIATLTHKRGLNSANFSPSDGCRLLTTDQNDELRVYSSVLWDLETTIAHPHRFFQHITPIKASWHPHQDLIMCGRYPDMINLPQFEYERCIDIFDASSGLRLGEMYDPFYSGIISMAKPNQMGTKVIGSMGHNLNLWNLNSFFMPSMRPVVKPGDESHSDAKSRSTSVVPPKM